jgi:anti-anti-sigma factor
MAIAWSSYEVHGVPVVELTGPLTETTVLSLEPELARLLASGTRVLVVDLSGLDACDAAGAAMLAACDRAATPAGVELRLAAPAATAGHALRTHGLMSRLRVFGSVDGAARGDAQDVLPAVPPAAGAG